MPKNENVKLINKLITLAEKLKNENILEYLQVLEKKYISEFIYCTLIGETSSGKSTYVNSILGKKIIPEMSIRSTGTIIKTFIYNNLTDDNLYKAIYFDREEELSLSEFQDSAINSSEDLEYLEIISTTKLNIDGNLCLIDTPGFNSSLRHRVILDNFLPQSDVILYFINYRRGLNPKDKSYLELIKKIIPDYKDTLIILVNFSGENINNKRLKEINKFIVEIIDYEKELYILSEKKVDNDIYLNQSKVESFLSEISNSNNREKIIENNLKNQLLFCLVELVNDIDEIIKSVSLKKSGSLVLENRIQELELLKNNCLETIKSYNGKFKASLNKLLEQFDIEITSEIVKKIEKESRIENVDSSVSFYKDHLAVHKINLLYDNINRSFNKLAIELGEELEYIEIQIETRELQDIDFNNESWKNTKKQLFEIIGNKVVSHPFKLYLTKIGGAAGEKAGIFNLGKKIVSKGGSVFGKKFKKQVYDSMGPMMKKLGINSSRAVAIWGVVVLEGIQKLYKTFTWKRKLLKSLEKGFSECIDKIKEENLKEIGKVNKINKELIEDNFKRRISPLERILKNGETEIKLINDNITECKNLVSEIEFFLKK